jgi:hypothetical protein
VVDTRCVAAGWRSGRREAQRGSERHGWRGPGLCARRLRRHGLPLARVLTVVPGAPHPRVHACARRRLRIPLLGRSGPPGRARRLGRTRRARLPARAARVQPCLPCRRRQDALGRQQRHRRLALQHPALGLRRLVLPLQLLVPKRVFRFWLHLCGIEKCKCCRGHFLSPTLWLLKVFIRRCLASRNASIQYMLLC